MDNSKVNQPTEGEKKRGGQRDGAGRPETLNKTFPVRCHPDRIKDVREFSRIVSSIEANYDKDIIDILHDRINDFLVNLEASARFYSEK